MKHILKSVEVNISMIVFLTKMVSNKEMLYRHFFKFALEYANKTIQEN
jgi:hypothetical protein